jgi:Flp pilus assembly pilin Flp
MAIQRIRHRLGMNQKGQGMTEYIIMVALIAIAAISIYTLFGKQIRSVVASIGGQLSGDTGAQTTSFQSDMEGQRDKTVTLENFDNQDF